jgi:hypothetical protein
MNYGKAVEEVWTWRETFEKELRDIPHDQQVKYINETAQKACKRLGIKCRKAVPRVKQHAC